MKRNQVEYMETSTPINKDYLTVWNDINIVLQSPVCHDETIPLKYIAQHPDSDY